VSTRALQELDDVLARSDDADEALRETVRILAAEPGIAWAGIAFLDEGSLVLGPSAGDPDERRRSAVPIRFEESAVGELVIDGHADPALLEEVAGRIAAHVLIGWDTGGEAWDP
jgi:putative methionine-R-sulfoxide reductase with GAF domain